MTNDRLQRSEQYLGKDRDELREIILDRDEEIVQLRGNLSLAEEGLANAMQEIAELRAFKQAVLDPENQPSQFGTTLVHEPKPEHEWYCVCGFPLASKDAQCTECGIESGAPIGGEAGDRAGPRVSPQPLQAETRAATSGSAGSQIEDAGRPGPSALKSSERRCTCGEVQVWAYTLEIETRTGTHYPDKPCHA